MYKQIKNVFFMLTVLLLLLLWPQLPPSLLLSFLVNVFVAVEHFYKIQIRATAESSLHEFYFNMPIVTLYWLNRWVVTGVAVKEEIVSMPES